MSFRRFICFSVIYVFLEIHMFFSVTICFFGNSYVFFDDPYVFSAIHMFFFGDHMFFFDNSYVFLLQFIFFFDNLYVFSICLQSICLFFDPYVFFKILCNLMQWIQQWSAWLSRSRVAYIIFPRTPAPPQVSWSSMTMTRRSLHSSSVRYLIIWSLYR